MAGSKVKKGFLYYFSIFIFLILGVFCILMAILIFNPGQDVYGINLRYISYGNKTNYYNLPNTETQIDSLTYDTVVFNGGFTDFNISYDPDSTFTKVMFKPNVTALTKSDNVKFDFSIEHIDNKLVITVKEPDIWLGFSKSATVSFVCPKDKMFVNYNFDITTKSGSVRIGDASDKQYGINNLNIKTETGNVNIYNNMSVSSNNINIESVKGIINVSSKITGTLNVLDAEGKINIGTLEGNLNVENTGTIKLNATNIAGDAFIKSKNGYVKIENLGYSEINKSGSIYKKYGYVDNFESDETLSGYVNGNITTTISTENTNFTLKNVLGNATITTSTGSIVIDKLVNQALIETTSGSVTIKDAREQLDITTTSGGVNLTQTGADVKTTADTQSGKIIANFTKIGQANLSTKTSNIEINVTTGEAFKFEYITKNGINISWDTHELEKNGTIYVSGANESSTNYISASAEGGKITLNDGFIK